MTVTLNLNVQFQIKIIDLQFDLQRSDLETRGRSFRFGTFVGLESSSRSLNHGTELYRLCSTESCVDQSKWASSTKFIETRLKSQTLTFRHCSLKWVHIVDRLRSRGIRTDSVRVWARQQESSERFELPNRAAFIESNGGGSFHLKCSMTLLTVFRNPIPAYSEFYFYFDSVSIRILCLPASSSNSSWVHTATLLLVPKITFGHV